MIVVKNKADCCGCTACYSVCPKKAISMQQDQEGFLYPFVEIANCAILLVLLKIKSSLKCLIEKHTYSEQRT